MATKASIDLVQPLLSREAFLFSLAEAFPEIAEEVLDEDYAGLIHLQISPMARYANQLISARQFETLKKLFDFFHHVVKKVDSVTENALYVSFLEHVDMAGDSDKATHARHLLQAEYLPVWRALWEGRAE